VRKAKYLIFSMFNASTRACLPIVIFAVVGWLSPMTAWAHRFGGPHDPCERKVGASLVHITLYQPQFDPDAEYCDVVPRSGNTVIVVDVLGDDLRRLPIGLQVVTSGESYAARTILRVEPKVYRRGVADAQVVLSEKAQYVARVVIENRAQPEVLSFPIRVTAWYRMLIVPALIVIALVLLTAISVARYYWSASHQKSLAPLIDLGTAGSRNAARGPRAARGTR
jgi:hypothetical protein